MADEAARTCSQVTGSGCLHTNKTFKLSFKFGTEKSGDVSQLKKMTPEKPKNVSSTVFRTHIVLQVLDQYQVFGLKVRTESPTDLRT